MPWSVIIPVCLINDELTAMFIECLESLNRRKNKFELIVVENGSDLVEADRRTKVIKFPKPIGYARAVNAGLKKAMGDRILIINSDATLVTPNWQGELDKVFDMCFNTGLVIPDLKNAGETAFTSQLVGPCWAVSKSMVNVLGFLPEVYAEGYYEDTEYYLRAKQDGWLIKSCRDVRVLHKGQSTFKALYNSEKIRSLSEKNHGLYLERNNSQFPEFT